MRETLAKAAAPLLGEGVQVASESDAPEPPVDFDLNRTAFFFDIDGTLLDIAASPLEVRVPESLKRALADLQRFGGGAIAFISGRPVAEMDRLFQPLKLCAVGGHGAEIRTTPHAPVRRSALAQLDSHLREEFARIAKVDSGIIVEDKGFSLAIHYRLAPQCGGAIMKHVAAVCSEQGCSHLEILPGKLVVEVKPSGYDKGTGLREMMSQAPFKDRRPLFIGDDITDNAAFKVLPEFGGVGFSVGGIVSGASYNFDGPQDVRRWIERLAHGRAAEMRMEHQDA